ncbi:hypothetical protein CPB84DRAFT_1794495 [Gymnopilus junonius]|uniref:Uncharacterized protein n=1 Tax=Gymnopilus junonius TaxID=109634 RepID=A0A9P5NCG1_GYMJU|nr:hypothetical protein CPB84DRAFT_1794495 [Gymnopilus junonius]
MAPVADALMIIDIQIWRCYLIWNRSIRIILIPSFLLFCEIGMLYDFFHLANRLLISQ